MKCAIYARQSSGDEEQSASIEQQIQNCKYLANQRELEIILIRCDNNVSGKTYPDLADALDLATKDIVYNTWKSEVSRQDLTARYRPGLAELLSNLDAIDFFIIYDLTRLMRPLTGSFLENYIRSKFVMTKTKILSVIEGEIDFTCFATSLVSSISGQINDNQIRTQTQKSKAALAKLKSEGYFVSGAKRYGYRQEKKHVWHIQETEAQIIRYCIDGIVHLRPYTHIAKDVFQNFGKHFNSNQIKNFAEKMYLTGFITNAQGEIIPCQETKHIPIIDFDIWKKANEIVSRSRKVIFREKKNYNPLAGLLRCGFCGKAMVMVKNGRKFFFRCKGADYEYSSNCRTINFPLHDRREIGCGIFELLTPFFIKLHLERCEEKIRILEFKKNHNQIQFELDRITEKEKELSQRYADDLIDIDQLTIMLSAYRKRKNILQTTLKEIIAAGNSEEFENAEELKKNYLSGRVGDILSGRISENTFRDLALSTFKKIVVYRDHILLIFSDGNECQIERVRQGFAINIFPKVDVLASISAKGDIIISSTTQFTLLLKAESVYNSFNANTEYHEIFSAPGFKVCQVGINAPNENGRYSEENLRQVLAWKQKNCLTWEDIDNVLKGNFYDAIKRIGLIKSRSIRKNVRNKMIKIIQ